MVLRPRAGHAVLRRGFAEAGIAALVFDYQNLGVSDGDVRQHLDPWAQIRDYQNALSYLETPRRRRRRTTRCLGDLLLGRPRADPRRHRPAGRRRSSARSRSSTGTATCAGSTARWDTASSGRLILEDRRNRYTDPANRLYIPHATADPEQRPVDVAVPGDLRHVQGAQGDARRRSTRTAARSSRSTCS